MNYIKNNQPGWVRVPLSSIRAHIAEDVNGISRLSINRYHYGWAVIFCNYNLRPSSKMCVTYISKNIDSRDIFGPFETDKEAIDWIDSTMLIEEASKAHGINLDL